MKRRWTRVLGAALVLASVALLVMIGTRSSEEPNKAGSAAAACDPNAKQADLSFKIRDMTGDAIDLAAYRGKVVLLNFWATWCGPCKIEIPGFVELQTKYRSRGLQVLGFSIDDPVAKLKPFADQFSMNYPVLVGLDRADVQEAYGPIWGVPITFLISRDGMICRKHAGISPKEVFEREIVALLGT